MKYRIALLLCGCILLSGCSENTGETITAETPPPVETTLSETTPSKLPVATVTEETAEISSDQPEEDKPIFASEEDKAAFELLGDYTAEHSTYPNRHVELHVGEGWELSEDYELFREYFFGSWGSQFHGLPYVIDDSKNAFIAKSSSFFMEFYKVGEDVLVFETGSAAGGTLYWLDKNVPDTLYTADGAPGDSPNWISTREDGFPGVWALHKSDAAPNEPENGYLSVYRLREMAQKHGIDYGLIVDVELEALPWARHDSRYYFYPMYLVSEADDRIEILTQAGDPYSYAVDIRIILQKIDGEWVRTVEESSEEFFPLKNPEYELIGAYLNDENKVCVDFSSMPTPEDYDLFREYFFGVWDSPDGYLPWSLTLDDSENINFAGRGYYGKFYQPKDYVIAFILRTNADAHVFWLDMYYPDVIYTASCCMTNELAFFTVQGITSDVHTLIRNDAAPSKPSDGFLSIFKLHEMARDYGIDFDLLTNIDYGMIDGKYYLHSATYDFYPMYLVSEADDKIVIRTTVGNLMETDLKPIEVICTFEKKGGEWVRTVESDG